MGNKSKDMLLVAQDLAIAQAWPYHCFASWIPCVDSSDATTRAAVAAAATAAAAL